MERVIEIINNVQESTNISNKNVYNLVEEFKKDKSNFINTLEQVYLTMIQHGLKYKKKSDLIEKLLEKFFYHLYETYIQNAEKDSKITQDDIYRLESPNVYARNITAKTLISLLKILKQREIEDVIDRSVVNNLVGGALSLLSLKQQNMKLMGLKISSYLQCTQNSQLNYEILKCMCQDDVKDLRKAALLTLDVSTPQGLEQNFSYLIQRTRDIDSDLRTMLYRKLTKEKILLSNLRLCDRYKLVYDGLGSREEAVKEQAIRYFQMNFAQCEVKDEQTINLLEDQGKTLATPQKRDFTGRKICLEISRFLEVFELEQTLLRPELYEGMQNLAEILLKDLISGNSIVPFAERVMKSLEPRSITKENPKKEELFLFRVLCQMVLRNDSSVNNLANQIEDKFPAGTIFSRSLETIWAKKELFEVREALLLVEMGFNCDESGRIRIIEVLKKMLLDIDKQFQAIQIESEEEYQPELEQSKQNISKKQQMIKSAKNKKGKLNGSNNNIEESKEQNIQNLKDLDYNDIYTKLDKDSLAIKKYTGNDYEQRIISETNDIIPIIVRILRRLLSDSNNEYSTFILQTISEVKEPLDKHSQGNLNEQRETLKKNLEKYTNEINKIELALSNLKANSRKALQAHADELYKLEKEKAAYETKKKIIQQDINQIETKIDNIIKRCLILATCLLQTCRLSLKDPGIASLLGSFIGPCFQIDNQEIKELSLRCLALYVLLDKTVCVDYLKVFKHVIDERKIEENFVANASEIIAIKAIFDFGVVHDIFNLENLGDDCEADPQELQETLIRYTLQADIPTRTICIEGFARLLYNDKINGSLDILVVFLVIWHDSFITKNGGIEAIQILSVFFRNYTTSSLQRLEIFEKGLEIFFYLLIYLNESKEFEFNTEFLLYNLNEDSILNSVRIGVTLLSYSYNKESGIFDDKVVYIGPPERFFIYLCILSRNKSKISKTARKIFEKVLSGFDFIDNCERETLNIVNFFLRDMISDLEEGENKQFEEFSQKILRRLKKDDTTTETELMMQQIEEMGNVKVHIDSLENDIKNLKTDITIFVKDFKGKNIIVKNDGDDNQLVPEKLEQNERHILDWEFRDISENKQLNKKKNYTKSKKQGDIIQERDKEEIQQQQYNDDDDEDSDEEEEDYSMLKNKKQQKSRQINNNNKNNSIYSNSNSRVLRSKTKFNKQDNSDDSDDSGDSDESQNDQQDDSEDEDDSPQQQQQLRKTKQTSSSLKRNFGSINYRKEYEYLNSRQPKKIKSRK